MTMMRKFAIGAEAICTDGTCGEVSRVVVDPVARALTHLVVEPKHRRGLGRLVPIALVDVTTGDEPTGDIHLGCTMGEFDQLDPAEETEFLPGGGGYGGYGTEQAFSWPYYGLGGAGMIGGSNMGLGGMASEGSLGGMGLGNATQAVTHDMVPAGEVAVHRGDQVHAADGHIGKVQGFIVDPSDHSVTHVLLQEGHLWGRKEVAIPIASVTHVDSGIQLRLTKQEVGDLPAVEIDRPSD